MMVFLMETKLRNHKMESVKNKTGYNGMFVVDCIGRSGRLALLWRDDIDVEIHNYSRRHINAKVNTHRTGQG
jgi:hypothetical protein